MYNNYEVAEKLGISIYTLKNWYKWQRKRLREGLVSEPYLPEPDVDAHAKGSPRLWDDKMIEQLITYKNSIVIGRNGIYGKYSNPYHKDTKKYKEQMEGKNNGTERTN